MALGIPFKYVLTQGFGPSTLSVEPAMYMSPDGQQACYAALPGWTRYTDFHPALDLAAPAGTPILASEAGTCTEAGNAAGLSLRIEIRPGVFYSHSHCSVLLVKEGDHVARDQVIAKVGMTGLATGNHSHFWVGTNTINGMIFLNPLRFLPGGDLANDPRIKPLGAEDMIQGTSPVAVTNRKTTVLGNLTNFRGDPSTTNAPLAAFPAATPFEPDYMVGGQSVSGSAFWYAGFLPVAGRLTLGYLHVATVGPLTLIEQVGHTDLELAEARAKGISDAAASAGATK